MFQQMEWSKEKTLKLVELLQVSPTLWNSSLCETRRDKQKRKEELRNIAEALGISVADTTKKIQHLRTQYNRESAREVRAAAEVTHDGYVSNWYAYEFLHFLKDSAKPYRLLQSEEPIEANRSTENCVGELKFVNISPPHKKARTDILHNVKSEVMYTGPSALNRDEFSVFGEYIANELRSLKGEKNLLVAKKKIQDAIFDVKMGLINEPRTEQIPTCTAYTHSSQAHNSSGMHNGKIYTSPVLSTSAHLDPLSSSHAPPTSGEIIINSACHYSNFKVDSQ